MTTLVRLSTPGRLLRDAAASFERARNALAAVGVDTGTSHATHATRTDAEQVAIFERYYTTDPTEPLRSPVDRRLWKGRPYYRRRGFPAAAIPGTSNHGRGDTVDWQNLGGYGSYSWNQAAAILREHGWNNDEGRRVGEPWHWTYVKADDNHLPTQESKPARDLEDSTMKPRYDTRRAGQRLIPDRWNTVKVTEKGGVSVAFGPDGWFETRVTVHVNAPSGTQLRVRFYRLNYKTGKRTYTYEAESKVDSAVTKGKTMCDTFEAEGSLDPDERVRCEIYTWDEGVTITSASYRTKEWK